MLSNLHWSWDFHLTVHALICHLRFHVSSEMSWIIWDVMCHPRCHVSSETSCVIWDVMCHVSCHVSSEMSCVVWVVTSPPGQHLCEMQRAGDHGQPWTEASRTETSCGRVCPADFSNVRSFTRSKTFKTIFYPKKWMYIVTNLAMKLNGMTYEATFRENAYNSSKKLICIIDVLKI